MAVRCEEKRKRKTSDQIPRRASDCGNVSVSKTRDGKENKQWQVVVGPSGEAAGVITGQPRGSQEDTRRGSEEELNQHLLPGLEIWDLQLAPPTGTV